MKPTMEILHLQAHLRHLEEATMTQSVLLSAVSHVILSISLIMSFILLKKIVLEDMFCLVLNDLLV